MAGPGISQGARTGTVARAVTTRSLPAAPAAPACWCRTPAGSSSVPTRRAGRSSRAAAAAPRDLWWYGVRSARRSVSGAAGGMVRPVPAARRRQRGRARSQSGSAEPVVHLPGAVDRRTRTLRGRDPFPQCPVERHRRGSTAGAVSGHDRRIRARSDLGLDVALASTRMFSFSGTLGDAGLGEWVEDGDDLTQRAAEPGEFADAEAVARTRGWRGTGCAHPAARSTWARSTATTSGSCSTACAPRQPTGTQDGGPTPSPRAGVLPARVVARPLDQAVDEYGKRLDRNRKLVDDRLDGMLKAQRHAVDRIVQRYHRLGAGLLDLIRC